RVPSQYERGERALPFRQVNRVHGWVAHRHHGPFWININGRHVQPKLGPGAQEKELAQAMHLDAGGDAEANLDPVAVLVSAQLVPGPVDLEQGAVVVLDLDHKRDLEDGVVRAERVFRADKLGPDRVAVADDAMNFAA